MHSLLGPTSHAKEDIPLIRWIYAHIVLDFEQSRFTESRAVYHGYGHLSKILKTLHAYHHGSQTNRYL